MARHLLGTLPVRYRVVSITNIKTFIGGTIMYICAFFDGVLSTLVVEIIVVFVLAITAAIRRIKK